MQSAAQLSLFPTPEDDSDQIPSLVVTRCHAGDLWQLGRHRLLCGDCTSQKALALLLDRHKPNMLLTDPPYGMRLDTDFSSMKGRLPFILEKGVKGGKKYRVVVGDHQDYDASPIVKAFWNVKEQFWFGADYYGATLGDTAHSGAWLVWDKRVRPQFDRMFGSSFELIWSRRKHKREILRHVWAGVFGTEQEASSRREHPTQKPLRLIEDIITRYSRAGWRIVDPYLGSGTTLIACERTQRICYGMEIEPQYCDVILSRWEKGTGQKATLLERLA